jgi:hypothetical protein
MLQQEPTPANLWAWVNKVSGLVDRLKQKHLTSLFVDDLSCDNIENKTWGVAIFLTLDTLLIIVGRLDGFALSGHFGASRTVLRYRFAVAALETD